ncbi:MAG TPA: hypothetical protein EYN06_01320, partial [Myxococcales bacterium]|nr:hypothetical protein [Myxococcales bacterium]
MRLFIVILLLVLAGTTPSIASERIESPHFLFVYQDGKKAMAAELARRSETVLKQVCATLGNKADEVGQINVAIYHGADAFNQALAQWGARVEWAAGIAIPSQNQILLRIDAQTRFNIHDIFSHEVSHIAL